MISDEDIWIPTEAFADAAGISVQAARGILRRAVAGGSWRGVPLVVRPRVGMGGQSGRAWEVSLASLPWDLQSAADPVQSAPQATFQSASSDRSGVAAIRFRAVAQALSLTARSPERKAAIGAAAARVGASERTLYRWVAQYERSGLRGLGRRRPANAGKRRVQVSRPFDQAFRSAGGLETDLACIGVEVDRNLKALWASRAEHAGVHEIRRLAEFLLWESCETHGLKVAREACRISRRRAESFAHYRVVNQRRNDRKAFDDAKPRIRRDWTMLAPMERVVADVKHLDVIVQREDGAPAWPKIVAFMDAGTGRVFVYPVLLERGEGVRQEHVIEAFIAMVSNPNWGFPQGLYLDNGAEFGALAKIDHALQLLNQPGARTLIYARPYNASAKPIESLFARLDRYVFSMLPGYAGPDRLRKKTQTVGRPPKPYPGTWASFCETVQGLIHAHNQRPVGGLWAERSPDAWFNEKVQKGWAPAQVDPWALDSAFSDHDSRRVDRGVLRINGVRYTHPLIHALPARTVVDLAIPWRRGAEPLFRTLSGAWAPLRRETPYPARWIEGARESSRRQQGQARHLASLEKDAPKLDPVEIKLRAAGRAVPAPAYASRPVQLDLGKELSEVGHARRLIASTTPSVPTPAERRQAQDVALTERLERKLNGAS